MISPFGKNKTYSKALRDAKAKEIYYENGKSIGFTYTASLKSMGRIRRSNGKFMLGSKYCEKYLETQKD